MTVNYKIYKFMEKLQLSLISVFCARGKYGQHFSKIKAFYCDGGKLKAINI